MRQAFSARLWLRNSIPALIGKWIEARERGDDQIVAWGAGSPTRVFLYVENVAEGFLLATERYNESDPVNLGSGMEISINDLRPDEPDCSADKV